MRIVKTKLDSFFLTNFRDKFKSKIEIKNMSHTMSVRIAYFYSFLEVPNPNSICANFSASCQGENWKKICQGEKENLVFHVSIVSAAVLRVSGGSFGLRFGFLLMVLLSSGLFCLFVSSTCFFIVHQICCLALGFLASLKKCLLCRLPSEFLILMPCQNLPSQWLILMPPPESFILTLLV